VKTVWAKKTTEIKKVAKIFFKIGIVRIDLALSSLITLRYIACFPSSQFRSLSQFFNFRFGKCVWVLGAVGMYCVLCVSFLRKFIANVGVICVLCTVTETWIQKNSLVQHTVLCFG
jgi:hypothetical protein